MGGGEMNDLQYTIDFIIRLFVVFSFNSLVRTSDTVPKRAVFVLSDRLFFIFFQRLKRVSYITK